MTYRKKLILLTTGFVLILSVILLDGFFSKFIKGSCLELYGSLLGCLSTIFFGYKYHVISLVTFSLLLSIIPLFFLREIAYKAWQKFAVVGLPIVAILIFLAPTTAPGDYIKLGYDREVASMLFSALFLLISWGVILYAILKNKKY